MNEEILDLLNLGYLMKEKILDLLILRNYSFVEVAEEFGLTIKEVRKICQDYLNNT